MAIPAQTRYQDSLAPVTPVVSTVQIPDPTTVLTLHDHALRRVRDSLTSTSYIFGASILPLPPPYHQNPHRRRSASRYGMPHHRPATVATGLPPDAPSHAAFPLSDGLVPLLVQRRGIEKSLLRPGRHGAYPSLPPAQAISKEIEIEIEWTIVLTLGGAQAIRIVKQGQLLWDPATRRAILTLQQLERIEKQPHMSQYLDDFDRRIAAVRSWAPELRMFAAPSQQDLESLGGLVII